MNVYADLFQETSLLQRLPARRTVWWTIGLCSRRNTGEESLAHRLLLRYRQRPKPRSVKKVWSKSIRC